MEQPFTYTDLDLAETALQLGATIEHQWVCIGHPAWPDPMVYETERQAHQWFEKYGRDRPDVVIVPKITLRLPAYRPYDTDGAEQMSYGDQPGVDL